MAGNNKNEKKDMNTCIEEFFDGIKQLVEDGLKDGDSKKYITILNSRKQQYPDLAENVGDVYQLAEDTLNGKEKPEDFEKKLEELKEQKKKDINDTQQAVGDQAAKKIEEQKKQEAINEIAREAGSSPEEIEEAVVNSDNVANFGEDLGPNEADIGENFGNDVDDVPPPEFKGKYDLKRPEDKAKLKKIYDYKVEGKIESGIKELDQFLGFIQPAIDQCIILAWKPIFWLMDKKDAAIESHEVWSKRKKELQAGWKTLQALVPEYKNKPFRWAQPIKEQEEEMATAFNKYMCEKMNATIKANRSQTLQNKHDEIYSDDTLTDADKQAEFNNYKMGDYKRDESHNRTDLFDDTKDPKWARYTIDDELLGLIRRDGSRDDKGKLTDDGKDLMKGYSVLLDLFNKKDKDDFVDRYVCDMDDLMKKANIGKGDYSLRKKHGVDKIEDVKTKDYIAWQTGELDTKKRSDELLEALSERLGENTK